MNLNDLRHFIAVVKYQGFSKAASKIFVSQPTLSKSVQRLEKNLDVTLFERSTRKLLLTDAGKLVYKQAIKIIDTTEELKTSLDDLFKVPSGMIKIGVPPLIGTVFFPKIAKGFVKINPKISLQLIEHGAKKIERLVETRQIDVGIVVLPVDERKFSVTPFIDERFQLLVPKKHPLTEQKKIHFATLEKEDFIIFTPEFSLHSLVKKLCGQRGGFEPNIIYETSQWDVITGLVAEGLGVTILPKSAADRTDSKHIEAIEINNPPMWKLGIVTKKGRYLSLAVRALLNFLQSKSYLNEVLKQ